MRRCGLNTALESIDSIEELRAPRGRPQEYSCPAHNHPDFSLDLGEWIALVGDVIKESDSKTIMLRYSLGDLDVRALRYAIRLVLSLSSDDLVSQVEPQLPSNTPPPAARKMFANLSKFFELKLDIARSIFPLIHGFRAGSTGVSDELARLVIASLRDSRSGATHISLRRHKSKEGRKSNYVAISWRDPDSSSADMEHWWYPSMVMALLRLSLVESRKKAKQNEASKLLKDRMSLDRRQNEKSSDISFREGAMYFQANQTARHSENYLYDIRNILQAHILPRFGRTKVSAIAKQDLDQFADDLLSAPMRSGNFMSPKTMRKIITIFKGVLAANGNELQILEITPAKSSRLPDNCNCGSSARKF